MTDKGVPAALVMATTRALLRAAAERLVAPGDVLARANDVLCPDIPPKMFVTCLYAVIDTATGLVRYANAGHDAPYLRRSAGGVEELRARGMPLGLLPGMPYDEKEITLQPGDTLLLYSDGLVEAHNTQRAMLGFPQLRSLTESHAGGAALIPFLMDQLAAFTGPNLGAGGRRDVANCTASGRCAGATSGNHTGLAHPGRVRLAQRTG